MPSIVRRVPALVIVGLCPLLLGCPNQNRAVKTAVRADEDDQLTIACDTLRKDPALDACKTAVAQLNVYLSRGGEAKPPALSTAERDLLTKLQPASPELNEIGREDFSPLDAHYLESCLLFHDAVRSLNLNFADKSAKALLERARLTFAWAMRQVWLLNKPRPALPASYTLRVGFGAAAERAAVALAALQQAGLDAGLVGESKDGKVLRPWAIGVLAGDEVYLFDFHSGDPASGPDGKGVTTLKQARANPDLVKGSIGAADPGSEVRAVAAASRVWLSPPLSSLAPRMRWLQNALTASPPIVLGIALDEVLERFTKAGEKPGFWNPPGNLETPFRLLAGFVPTAEGGQDPGKPGERAFELYARVLIPLPLLPALFHKDLITGDPREKMVSLFSGRFLELALEPGKPRDQLLRGRFDDASRGLVEWRTRIDTVQQRIATEPTLEQEATEWADAIRKASGAYLSLKNNPRANPDDVAAAKSRVDQINKNSEKMRLLIEQAAAEPFGAVVTYQLALCKHEQAERLSRDRSSASDKRDAWQNAIGSWENFVSRFSSSPMIVAAQLEHARRLLVTAQRSMVGGQ